MDEGGFSAILKEAAERRRRFEELQKKLEEEDKAKAQQALEDRRRNRKQADERIRHPNYKPPPKRVHKKQEVSLRPMRSQPQQEHQQQQQHQQQQRQAPSQQRQRWAAAQEDARRRDAEQLRAARRVELRGFLAQQREQSHAPTTQYKQPLDWPLSLDSKELGSPDACAGSRSPAKVQGPALCWRAVKKEAQQGFQELMRQAGLPVNAGFSRPSSFSVQHRAATQPPDAILAHAQGKCDVVAHYTDSMLRELGLLEAHSKTNPAISQPRSSAAENSQISMNSVTEHGGQRIFCQPPRAMDVAAGLLKGQEVPLQPCRSVSPRLTAVSRDAVADSKQLRLMRLNSDVMASGEGLGSSKPFAANPDQWGAHEQQLECDPANPAREPETCVQELDSTGSQVEAAAQLPQQPVLQWVLPDNLDYPPAQPPVQQDSAMALPWEASCSQGGSASLQTCFSLLGSSSGFADPAEGDLPRLDSPAWETMLGWDSTEGHSRGSSGWAGLAGSTGSAVSTNSYGGMADRLTGLEQGVQQLQQLRGDIEQGLAGQLGCDVAGLPGCIGKGRSSSRVESFEQATQGRLETALQAREPTLAHMGVAQVEALILCWEAGSTAPTGTAPEHEIVTAAPEQADSKQALQAIQQQDQQAAVKQQHHLLTSLAEVSSGPEQHQVSGACDEETGPQPVRSFLQQAYALISRLKSSSSQASSPGKQVQASGLHTARAAVEEQWLSGGHIGAANAEGVPQPAAAAGEPSSKGQQGQPVAAPAVGAASPSQAVASGSGAPAPGASNPSESFLHRVSRQLMQAGSHAELQGMLGSHGSHSEGPLQHGREQSSPHTLLTAQQGWDVWEQQQRQVPSWAMSRHYQPAAPGPVMPTVQQHQQQQQQAEQQERQLQQSANLRAGSQLLGSMNNQAPYQQYPGFAAGAWHKGAIPALQHGYAAENGTGLATGSKPHHQVQLESAWSVQQQPQLRQQQHVAQPHFQQQQHNEHPQHQRDQAAVTRNQQVPTSVQWPQWQAPPAITQRPAYQQPLPGTTDYHRKPSRPVPQQPAAHLPHPGQALSQTDYASAAATTTTQSAAKRPAGAASPSKPDAPRKHEGSYVHAARLAKERAVRDETERKELQEQSQALRAAAKQRLKHQSKQASNQSPPRAGTSGKSSSVGKGTRLGMQPAPIVAAPASCLTPAADLDSNRPTVVQQQAGLSALVHRGGVAAVEAAAASPPCDTYKSCPWEPEPAGIATQIRPRIPATIPASPRAAGGTTTLGQPVQAAGTHGSAHSMPPTGQPKAAPPQQGAKGDGPTARILGRLGGRGKKGQAAQLLKLAADEKMLSEHEGLVRQSLARLNGQLAARGLPSSDLDSALSVAPRANSLMQLRLNKSIARLDGQLAGVLPAKPKPTPPVGKPLGPAASTPCKSRRVKPVGELDTMANSGAAAWKQRFPSRQHNAPEPELQQRQAVRVQQAAPLGSHPGQSVMQHEATGAGPSKTWQQVCDGAGAFYTHAQPVRWPGPYYGRGTATAGASATQQMPVAQPRHLQQPGYQHAQTVAAQQLPQHHCGPYTLGPAHQGAVEGQTHGFPAAQQAAAPLGGGPPTCSMQPAQGRVPGPAPCPQHPGPSRLQPLRRLGQHKKQPQPPPEQPGRILQGPAQAPWWPREALLQGSVPALPQQMLPPLGVPGSQASWGTAARPPGAYAAPQTWPTWFAAGAGYSAGNGPPLSCRQLPPVQQRAQQHIYNQQLQHMAAFDEGSGMQQQGVPWHPPPSHFLAGYM